MLIVFALPSYVPLSFAACRLLLIFHLSHYLPSSIGPCPLHSFADRQPCCLQLARRHTLLCSTHSLFDPPPTNIIVSHTHTVFPSCVKTTPLFLHTPPVFIFFLPTILLFSSSTADHFGHLTHHLAARSTRSSTLSLLHLHACHGFSGQILGRHAHR